ncbi:hypothetical protein ES332_D03G108300v1 [Gossypium tomentosum]|uniref:Uncharacterized protein n=1 Tax=Gossypium tomentosum TaxID=34277 RepID=A0A5D2LKS9_GOSTO|nr:hypothetical protein ES332_D03G108300v1 [Gossypium tomentosum]
MSEEYGARLSSLLVARDERKSGKLKRLGILGRVTSAISVFGKLEVLLSNSSPFVQTYLLSCEFCFFRVFKNVRYTTTKVGRASINLYFAMAECIDGCPHANYDLSKVFFWAVLNVPLTWMNRA